MSQEKKPWVSFCMSTYKRPEFLKNTVNSIRAQSFSDFEVIVSDNDPEATAEAVIKKINDPRIHYYSNGDNLGMIKSFNKSIERSQADFVVMITDDDPVYPDMLDTLYTLTIDYPGYGMYMGGCDWVSTSHEVARFYNLKVGTNSCLSSEHDLNFVQCFEGGEFVQQLFTFSIFPHYLWSTCLIKREVLLKMGSTPDYGTPFLGDYAFLALMSSQSGCVVINKSLGCQTLHKGNFGRNQNEQIAVAAKNFPVYVGERISDLKDWPVIKGQMLHFIGMWVVSHMSFLYHYFKNNSLRQTEKEVFAIDYMKKYKLKYFLKTRMPLIHDAIVKLKKAGKK